MPLNPINPAAGDVKFPEDPVELEASTRAGAAVWAESGYLRARFAERGERFSMSDAAYLAWLSRLPLDRVEAKVRWLGPVLSNRGMPQVLLERKLRFTAQALREAIPAKGSAYARLEAAADMLERERQAVWPAGEAAARQARFREAVGPGAEHEEAARLLTSGAADAALGVKHAIRALMVWYGDETRFSRAFCRAARAVVRR